MTRDRQGVLWLFLAGIVLRVGIGDAVGVEDALHVRPGTGNPIQAAVDEALAREPIPEIVVHEGVYPGSVKIEGGKPGRLVIRAERKPNGGFVDAIVDGGQKALDASALPGEAGVYRIAHRYTPRRSWPSLWETDTRVRYTLVADADTVAAKEACFAVGKADVVFRTSDGKPPASHEVWMARDNAGLDIRRSDVTVQGLQFRGFHLGRGSAGVSLYRGTGHVVEDCRVWGCVRGVSIAQHCEGPRIRRCRADDVGGGVYSQGTGEIIEDCIFVRRDNAFKIQCGDSQDQAGIEHYYPNGGGEAYRNLIVGFHLGIFYKTPPGEFLVEYNTVVGHNQRQGIGRTGFHPETVFRYNIVTGYPVPITGGTTDRNLFSGGKGPVQGEGPGNVRGEPRFADPAREDYRLLPDSPGARLGEDGRPAGALGVADGRPFTRAILPVAGAEDVQPPPPLRLPATDVQHIAREGPPRAWYVDAQRGAEHAGEGTAERPFRSLQSALNRANPGDRVMLAPGVYLGAHRLEHGGTADAPIVIEAAEPHTAVLDGLYRTDVCLRLKNAPHVTIRGLEIRWFRQAGIEVADSPHARIEGCRMWNRDDYVSSWVATGTGIEIRQSPDVVITKNLLFRVNSAIRFYHSPRFTLTYNTVCSTFLASLGVHGSAAGSVCRNNSLAFPGNGIYSGLSQEQMKTFDCDYNNLFFYLRDDYAKLKPPPPGERAKPFRGDAFGAGTKGLAYVNGLKPRGYITSISEWRNYSGVDRHSIFFHPKYVDPRGHDYRLAPDSPNIGAGASGTTIGALGPDSAPLGKQPD
ncbi:MAG: right-handed parallel beta-helix repeat-containing protein [Kiritimatiellae bacterium]|nr:right-handed parallel beta-helix repeat-containing protein [Kiritimatiellia bacterium]